jgi:hypothetical protein
MKPQAEEDAHHCKKVFRGDQGHLHFFRLLNESFLILRGEAGGLSISYISEWQSFCLFSAGLFTPRRALSRELDRVGKNNS